MQKDSDLLFADNLSFGQKADAAVSVLTAVYVFFVNDLQTVNPIHHSLFAAILFFSGFQIYYSFVVKKNKLINQLVVLIREPLFLLFLGVFLQNSLPEKFAFFVGLFVLQTAVFTFKSVSYFVVRLSGYALIFVILVLVYDYSTIVWWSFGSSAAISLFLFFPFFKNKQTLVEPEHGFLSNEIENVIKILNDIDLLVFSVDENGQIRYWNRKCEIISGYPQNQISAKPDMLKRLFQEENDYVRIRNIITAEHPALRKFESKIINRFGHKKIISWELLEYKPEGAGSQNWFVGTDVTESYNTWLNLQKANQQLSDIQSIAKIGMWDWNPADNRIDWSSEMFKMFGLKEIDNSTDKFELINQAFEPSEYIRIQKALKKAVDNKKPLSIEYEISLPSGDKRIMLFQGTHILGTGGEIRRFRGTNQDITELKKAEQKSRNIIHAAPDAIIVTDLEYTITDYNRSAYKILNAHEQNLVNMNLSVFFASGKEFGRFDDIIAARARSAIMRSEQFKLKTYTQEAFFSEISAGIIGKFETPDSFVFFIKNINTRIKYEKDLKEAKRKAVESDKLKSAFLANMSHEIRTPMNAIVGFANLLGDPSASEEERQEYVKYIETNSSTLMTLINDIIDISKIEAGEVRLKYQPVQLKRLVDGIVASGKEQAKQSRKQLRFFVDMSPGIENTAFLVDKVRLKQVLDNLVNNAVKFTKNGEIRVICKSENSEILFGVKDTGVGIAPDDFERIFERFTKVESANDLKRGTGLGLSISSKLVELMKGKLTVKSGPGKGSEFNFRIPAKPAEPVNVSHTDKNGSEEADWSKHTILVAEDEMMNFVYLKTALRKTKVKIEHVTNGEDAVNFVKNKVPDLILMDIGMPIIDGYEATRQIKKIAPNVPVIAQTAFAMSDEQQRMEQAGCDSYISKPINRVKLIKMLENYLKKSN